MVGKIGTNIEKAVDIITNGGLVAIPTETVYGLASNAFNSEAVTAIFKAKNRPSFDPLISHVASIEQLETLVWDFPLKARQLANKFWPGPLTLVLPKTSKIDDLVTSGLPNAAFRIPQHPLTLSLLKKIKFPLAAPSANPFGYVSPTTAQHVADQLGSNVDYILDGGPCGVGVESTIVSFASYTPKILRLGGLSIEDIEHEIGTLEVQQHSSSKPQAPGMLTSHYSPGKKLVLGNIETLLKENHSKKTGVISFQKEFPDTINRVLSPAGSLSQAAQNLFKVLRWMANQPIEIIIAEPVPDIGLGKAINDRLKRAST